MDVSLTIVRPGLVRCLCEGSHTGGKWAIWFVRTTKKIPPTELRATIGVPAGASRSVELEMSLLSALDGFNWEALGDHGRSAPCGCCVVIDDGVIWISTCERHVWSPLTAEHRLWDRLSRAGLYLIERDEVDP
jgi:hypothetical protein